CENQDTSYLFGIHLQNFVDHSLLLHVGLGGSSLAWPANPPELFYRFLRLPSLPPFQALPRLA
ncbi:hypothetical protein ACE1BG_21895, partial [Aeromonas veronii]|uniref:hypothetical protein n=1 Tax=Aeromonas veronii TaxID=654 RepID=UPI0035B7A563